MISLKKINNCTVKPLRLEQNGDGNKPIKGAQLFPELYSNILICAKKKSGKSNVIANIVKSCSVPKLTTVLVFCSTVHKDGVHIAIKKLCEKLSIPYVAYTSLLSDGVDMLEAFLKNQEEP